MGIGRNIIYYIYNGKCSYYCSVGFIISECIGWEEYCINWIVVEIFGIKFFYVYGIWFNVGWIDFYNCRVIKGYRGFIVKDVDNEVIGIWIFDFILCNVVYFCFFYIKFMGWW